MKFIFALFLMGCATQVKYVDRVVSKPCVTSEPPKLAHFVAVAGPEPRNVVDENGQSHMVVFSIVTLESFEEFGQQMIALDKWAKQVWEGCKK